MGTMTFLLPADSGTPPASDLERACVAGGPDGMPYLTETRTEAGRLILERNEDESGTLLVPWEIDGAGRLMTSSATLMERQQPYSLILELSRGKINQVRCQASEAHSQGIALPGELVRQIHEAIRAFGEAVTEQASASADGHARLALARGASVADQLMQTWLDQVLTRRHDQNVGLGRPPQLETSLGCRLGAQVPQGAVAEALVGSFTTLCLPLAWHQVQPTETEFHWGPHDALVEWAMQHDIELQAGPLVDFSSSRLPEWLWHHERNLSSLVSFLRGFVEKAVRRYRTRIRRWQFTAGSNCARVLSLGDQELLWLTLHLAEVAKQVDPGIEVVVGLAQPWGDYLGSEERLHSPFVFADTLVRTGLSLAAIDLEFVLGITPRGSYCRDRLELSRILDLYSLLGVPLRATLGYPSSDAHDPEADPELRVAAGRWRSEFSPANQADWAEAFATLLLSKDFVHGITWIHASDAEPHQFPHCGLVDAQGIPKPALDRLRELRQRHLL